MSDEKLTTNLQKAVLSAVCFDGPNGAIIAAQVKPEHFDSVYRDFVTRVLQYRRRYGRPPRNYITDLAAQSSFGRDNTLVAKQLIPDITFEAEEQNTEYVVTRVQDFVRRQTLKGALIEAGNRYVQDDDEMVGDVERIFHTALKFRHTTLDGGIRLNDSRGLNFLVEHKEGWPIGIPQLDRLGVTPVPKELMLYIAPKGAGKTWFCVHVGKQSLMQRLRVLHVTLEMGELKVLRRYYQALFSIARNSERVPRSTLDFDELHRLSGFSTKRIKPQLDFTDPRIGKKLADKMKPWGARLGGLIIKEFPTGQLTVDQLVGYLDYLESVENFVPHILIVDYPKLMMLDRRSDPRVSIGRNMEELRGLGVKRNMAVIAPHQGTRSTIGARNVRSSDAGEDISVVQTADNVLTFSRTSAEEARGLGRLRVAHARDAEGGAVILLTQAYGLGQYVLESAQMQNAYWDKLKEVSGGDEGEDEE